MLVSEQQIFIDFNKLKINSKYEKLVPRMSREDDQTFDESIKTNGIREPLTINRNDVVLDGHSRYSKAEKYNIKLIPITRKHFENKLEEEKYVIETNLERRHLNNWQKIELGIPLLKVEQQISKLRMVSNLKKGDKPPLAQKKASGKSASIIAKKIGLSTSTVEAGKVVYENADEKLKEKLRRGSISIKSAHTIVTAKTRNLPKIKMPEGQFDIILCDVPIGFKNKSIRGSAVKHYDTMTPEELVKLKIPSSDNAIIFFWMSPSIMFDVVESDRPEMGSIPTYKFILDAWGFKTIKAEFSWNKEIIGLGSWNRNQHENLLMAIKGKMPTPLKLFSSVIEQLRDKHSAKPDIVYSMIEEMYPTRNYLELFARSKHSENWTVFGNQIEVVTK